MVGPLQDLLQRFNQNDFCTLPLAYATLQGTLVEGKLIAQNPDANHHLEQVGERRGDSA